MKQFLLSLMLLISVTVSAQNITIKNPICLFTVVEPATVLYDSGANIVNICGDTDNFLLYWYGLVQNATTDVDIL